MSTVHTRHHLTDAFSFSLFPVVLTSNHVPRVGVTHLCDQCAFATTDIDVLLQHYEACHTLINLKGAHQHVKAEEDVGTNKEGSNKGGAGGEREFSCTKCHFITEVEEEIFRHYRWGVRPLVTSEDRRINGTQRSASLKQQWISEESNVILCFQLADLDHRFLFFFCFCSISDFVPGSWSVTSCDVPKSWFYSRSHWVLQHCCDCEKMFPLFNGEMLQIWRILLMFWGWNPSPIIHFLLLTNPGNDDWPH